MPHFHQTTVPRRPFSDPTFALGRLSLITVITALMTIAAATTLHADRPSSDSKSEKQKSAKKESAESGEQSKSKSKKMQDDASSTKTNDEHADDECPALGLIVGSCPGQGVCVLDTVWASPADEAGIVHGDYILSVDGTDVSTPKQLIDAIKKQKDGKSLSIQVWRQGDTIRREVTLASKADKPPPSDKAWLGVMLTPADSGNESESESADGILVRQVMRGSPAAQAGLRPGDRIVACHDQSVGDVRDFAQSVEDKGPGSELTLTVQRDGQEKQIDVTLGHIDDAPIRFMRRAIEASNAATSRPAQRAPDTQDESEDGGVSEALEESLDEMRARLRALENRMEKWQGKDREKDSTSASVTGESASTLAAADTATRKPVDAASSIEATQLVLQWDRRGDDRTWNDRRGRSRNWDANDWRRGYRSPLNRSPRYGNQYYRYGGRPYYRNYGSYGNYGRNLGRSSVRIGGFGLWW